MTGLIELFLLAVLLYWLFGSSGRILPVTDIWNTVQYVHQNWGRTSDAYKSVVKTKKPADGWIEEMPKEPEYLSEAGLLAATPEYPKKKQRNTKKDYQTSIFNQLKCEPYYPLQQFVTRRPRNNIRRCCTVCVPRSSEAVIKKAIPGSDTHNVLQVNEGPGFFKSHFKHLVHVWNIIRFPYPEINKEVLREDRVKMAIQRAAKVAWTIDFSEKRKEHDDVQVLDLLNIPDEGFKEYVKHHEKQANSYLQVMRSKLNDLLLRLTSYVLYKLLPIFLNGVIVKNEQVAMLQEAAKKDIPLIFLPLHRSHLDYILMTFILLNNKVKAPIVAAGDNLKIPVFGSLLRGLGAFYIKRKIDPAHGKRDFVYRGVLQTYMEKNLKAGHNMEFFIEGGRTRTGKTCMPKGGLLSVIVDAHKEKLFNDALLVPVSINYERLVDGNFICEQLGQPKIMESFRSASRAIWHVLNSSYGMMRVDFCEPFSLSELLNSYQNFPARTRGCSVGPESSEWLNGRLTANRLHRPPSSVSLYGTDVVVEEQRCIVEDIARHIVFDSDRNMALMTTNAIAFLLLHKYRNGTTLDELADSLDVFRLKVTSMDRDCGFTGDSVDVINHAVKILGCGLITKRRASTSQGDTIFIEPVTVLPNVIELSYYSNAVLSLYVLEAVIATAMISQMPESTWKIEQVVSFTKADIITKAQEICKILQFEFIFTKPCESLEEVLQQTFEEFCFRDYVKSLYNTLGDRSMAADEEDYYEEMTEMHFKLNEDFRSYFKLLCSTLRPLLEGYCACASRLEFMLEQPPILDKELLEEIRNEAQRQLDVGRFKYAESLSADPMRNALKLLEKWDVLDCSVQGNTKFYNVSDHYNFDIQLQPVLSQFQSLVCTVENTSDSNQQW